MVDIFLSRIILGIIGEYKIKALPERIIGNCKCRMHVLNKTIVKLLQFKVLITTCSYTVLLESINLGR